MYVWTPATGQVLCAAQELDAGSDDRPPTPTVSVERAVERLEIDQDVGRRALHRGQGDAEEGGVGKRGWTSTVRMAGLELLVPSLFVTVRLTVLSPIDV